MSRINWTRDQERRAMQTRGVDNIKEDDPDAFAILRRKTRHFRRTSKDELRAQAAAAIASGVTVRKIPSRR